MQSDPQRPDSDRPTAPRRASKRPRPTASRFAAAAATALLAAVLGACQVTAPPSVSDLRAIEGPVEGYPDGVARDFEARRGGFDYGSGSIVPGATPRVEGILVAVDDLEEGALGLPSGPACAELDLDPIDLRIHWQVDLFVIEGDEVVGYLARSNAALFLPQTAGERLYGYLAASTAGSVAGSCDLGSEVVTWDLELLEGWNHVVYRMDEDDPVRRSSIRVEAPDPAFPWRFFLPN